ncbi:MAG: methyltransferase, partial [Microbacterium sp.]
GECAAEAVFGMPGFEYLKRNPADAKLFDLMMQHSPDDRHAAVVAAYDFSASLVVDVGGGNGALLAAILRNYSDASGVLFDQEAVVAGAADVLGPTLVDRCRTEVGDFFESVTRGGDIYTLSQILHDWDDDRCATILANCRAAMGPNKRLLVIDRLLEQEPGRTNPMNFLADITMMVHLHGRERTPAELTDMLTNAGFSQPRIVHTTSPFSILEATSV